MPRRYTKREKAVAVTAALASSVKAAAETQGIPERTLGYWMEHPEFADLRAKTREDLAAEMKMLAHLAASELAKKIRAGDVEARDLIVALGVVTDKSQLLTGAATSRHESRDLTSGLSDHERDALTDAIDEWLAGRANPDAGKPPVGAGSEVRE